MSLRFDKFIARNFFDRITTGTLNWLRKASKQMALKTCLLLVVIPLQMLTVCTEAPGECSPAQNLLPLLFLTSKS